MSLWDLELIWRLLGEVRQVWVALYLSWNVVMLRKLYVNSTDTTGEDLYFVSAGVKLFRLLLNRNTVSWKLTLRRVSNIYLLVASSYHRDREKSRSRSHSRERRRSRSRDHYHKSSRQSRSRSYDRGNGKSRSPPWRISRSRNRRYSSQSRSPRRRYSRSPLSRSHTEEEEAVTDTFIRAVAAEVKGQDSKYEDALRERERNNPKYAFLLHRNVGHFFMHPT